MCLDRLETFSCFFNSDPDIARDDNRNPRFWTQYIFPLSLFSFSLSQPPCAIKSKENPLISHTTVTPRICAFSLFFASSSLIATSPPYLSLVSRATLPLFLIIVKDPVSRITVEKFYSYYENCNRLRHQHPRWILNGKRKRHCAFWKVNIHSEEIILDDRFLSSIIFLHECDVIRWSIFKNKNI